ncbi:MAG: ABC transporter substrate-binding protein [Candidatus Heimdallarchaeota archaeon]
MKLPKKQVVRTIFFSITFMILAIQLLATSVVAQEEEAAYFTISFLVTADNQDLLKVAQLIEKEMWKIGIETNLEIQQEVRDRTFRNMGYRTFDEGGFDLFFYGWYDGLSAPSTLLQFFHSDKTTHGFGNFFPVVDRGLDRRLNLLGTTADYESRIQLVELILDQLIWELHPMTSLYQEEEIFAVDSELSGFDPVQMRMERVEFLDGQTELSFAGLTPLVNYNPFLALGYYESLISQQLFDGLLGADADYNYFPLIAEEAPLEVSGYNRVSRRNVDEGEGLLWDVKIRSDVYWHDGYGFTNETVGVDDVVFTYRTALNPQVRPSFLDIFQTVFGSNPSLPFEQVDNTTIRFHLAESVREISTLFSRKQYSSGGKAFYSDRFLDLPSVFSLPILPRHILDPLYDSTGEGIGLGGLGRTADGAEISGYNGWALLSDFNLGSRSEGFAGRAVVGTGPYQLDEINTAEQYIETTAFPYYYKTLVDGEYSFKPQKFLYDFSYDKYEAETRVVNGTVSIVDSNYDLLDDIAYLQSFPTVQVQKKRGWQMYALAYNTFNPYIADPNVRLAISHLIPRQKIIDYVFGGVAHPAFAPLPEQSPYWSERIPRISYNLTRAWEYMEKAGYDMSDLRDRLQEDKSKESSGSFIPLAAVLFGILAASVIKRRRRSFYNKH